MILVLPFADDTKQTIYKYIAWVFGFGALRLGDVKLKNFMLVEKCRHTYRENEHWMDLTLRGGEFVG